MVESYIPGTIENRVIKSEDLYLKAGKDLKKKFSTLGVGSFYIEQTKDFPINPNQTFVSTNQKLVGKANPKTLKAPLIVPRPMDLDYWKSSDLSVMSGINTRSQQDFGRSGYYVDPDTCNNYDQPDKRGDIYEGYQYNAPTKTNGYKLPYYEGDLENDYITMEMLGPGSTSSGYVIDNVNEPQNRKFDLPVNYAAKEGQLSNTMKKLNDELFTSIITPGSYYKTDIIEPIQWNEGISFTQQIPPREESKNSQGTLYTAKEPSMYHHKPPPKKDWGISPYDVYDSRGFGYGTSYRSYEDTLTGQPRFYYDDTDAIRRPNYLGRSKVDHIFENITYGPIATEEEFFDNNARSRDIAEKDFLDQSIAHRTDMMTHLMRKKNAEAWQQKLAPLGAQRSTLGSMGKTR